MKGNLDSGIQEIFAHRIRSNSNPESKFHRQGIQIPVVGVWNPWRGIQNPRLSWII